MKNVDVIGQNVRAILDARQLGNTSNIVLKKGWGMMPGVVCTVGPHDGVAELFGGCFYTQYVIPAYKNRTLFLDLPLSHFGLTTAAAAAAATEEEEEGAAGPAAAGAPETKKDK
jgi:hypothetical protein